VSSESFRVRLKRFLKQPFFLILQGLLYRIPFQPVEIALFYLLYNDGLLPRRRAQDHGIGEVREGKPEDIETLTRIENKEETFLKRFKTGEICLVTLVNEKVVGYEWFSMAPGHLEERYRYYFQIPSDTVYGYDAFILPDYRKKGLYYKIHERIWTLLKGLNKRRVMSMIDYGNAPSMGAHRNLGFYPKKIIFYFRFLGFRFFKEKEINGQIN